MGFFNTNNVEESKNKFKNFFSLNDKEKLLLIKVLGYDINQQNFIINKETKEKIKCRYTNKFIKFEDSSILPGSTIIINTTPVTLSKYIDEFLEKDG